MIMDTGRHRKPMKLMVCLGILFSCREGAARSWEFCSRSAVFQCHSTPWAEISDAESLRQFSWQNIYTLQIIQVWTTEGILWFSDSYLAQLSERWWKLPFLNMEVSFNFLVALKYFKSYGFPPTALLLLQSGFMDYILLSCMSAWLHLLPYPQKPSSWHQLCATQFAWKMDLNVVLRPPFD